MVRAAWFSPVTLVLVICGGAVGVAARAALTVPFAAGAHPLLIPGLTLVINLLGAFLLGVVVGALDDRHPRARSFLGTGVLGGFTTYSAFAVQVVTTSGSSPLVGLALAAVTLFGGALAAAAGLGAGRRMAHRPGEVETPEDAE
ncbi:FluC/FEX family fluoride channel [Microbacterium flavum]|uniref:FluC/FEX family fluoride channel n=1 Tax=Microbacterium flavum TaxID=415216 RepID=UPI0024AE1126|nr:CrcB family protein [Microbacterium flavum]